MSLNLTKATEEVTFNLTKRGLVAPNDINVSLLLDFSGSMDHYYRSGTVAKVLQRLLSISNTIDDDGILQLVPFHHTALPPQEITVEQYDDAAVIIRKLMNEYSMGGTAYSPAMDKLLGVLSNDTPVAKATGFFSRLFAKNEPAFPKIEGKQLIILITDGEPSDQSEFLKRIHELEKTSNIYLQTIAVAYDSNYLRTLAERSDSVGYTSISDFDSSDEALIESIINPELLAKLG